MAARRASRRQRAYRTLVSTGIAALLQQRLISLHLSAPHTKEAEGTTTCSTRFLLRGVACAAAAHTSPGLGHRVRIAVQYDARDTSFAEDTVSCGAFWAGRMTSSCTTAKAVLHRGSTPFVSEYACGTDAAGSMSCTATALRAISTHDSKPDGFAFRNAAAGE